MIAGSLPDYSDLPGVGLGEARIIYFLRWLTSSNYRQKTRQMRDLHRAVETIERQTRDGLPRDEQAWWDRRSSWERDPL